MSSQDMNFNQEVKDTMKVFAGANDGQRFARAVLEFAYGLSHDDAIDANSCDGTLDRGLDAHFSDADYLYLMQFKYHENPFGKKIEFSATSPTQQLIHCWPYVSNLSHASSELAAKRIRQELYDAAVTFRDEVEQQDKRVRFVVVEWADGPVEEAEASGRSWLGSFPIGHRMDSLSVENFHSIRRLWDQRKVPVSRYDGSLPVKFLKEEGLINLTKPHQAVVVQVLGRDLVDLFTKVGESLFDPNVRFELTKSKFNMEIGKTASSEPENFWYYNNGITMICSDFKIVDSNTLQVEKPGVVNGGQTIKQLAQAGNLPESLRVLVRIIRSEKESFDRSIALYTNSQNPITLRDLASNRKEQIMYQVKFQELPIPWFYERKRGAWDIAPLSDRQNFMAAGSGKGRKSERRFSNEDVGKSVLSFSIQQPVVAKTSTPAIWTEPPGGYYEEIFWKGRDVYELAVSALANRIVQLQRATYQVSGGIGSKEEIKNCIPHITALVGYLVMEKYNGIPLRADLQRMYGDLMDPTTQYISKDNFVTKLFSTVLFPFVVWYNSSRRATDPLWEAANWYKQAESYDPKGDVKSMLPAFELFRGFTPPAKSGATSALIP